jgi:hypothetical protein
LVLSIGNQLITKNLPIKIFFDLAGHFPWRRRVGWLKRAAMTRTAIERCIWVFIVALIATFGWTVTQVIKMLGWF